MRLTMGSLFLNSICFWDDPDVVCVRPPLSFQQAQVWATLLGITGQLLMTSDDMPALPEDRVELLRRIFPVADIRPMELYGCAAGRGSSISASLRRGPAGGTWSRSSIGTRSGPLPSASTRRNSAGRGQPRLLRRLAEAAAGRGGDGLTLALPPASCRLVAVRRQADHPQLVGASRHITQERTTWSKPHGTPPRQAGAERAAWWRRSLRVAIHAAVGLGLRRRRRENRGPAGRADTAKRGVEDDALAGLLPQGRRATAAARPHRGEGRAGRLDRDRRLAAHRGDGLSRLSQRQALGADDRRAFCRSPATAAAATVTRSPPSAGRARRRRRRRAKSSSRPRRGARPRTPGSRKLKPISQLQDFSEAQLDRSIEGKPLRVCGKTYAHGLGAHAVNHTIYRLDNRYRRFEAEVGVDDEKGGQGTRRVPGVFRRTQSLRQRRDARQSGRRKKCPCRWTASRS